MNSLSELDEAIQHDYPEIFEEWVAANEDQKSALIVSDFLSLSLVLGVLYSPSSEISSFSGTI